MNQIQTDISEGALITAIRANMCDFFRVFSRSNVEEYFENEKFTRWYSPVPYPWFNGVLSSQVPVETDETFIANTIEYFRAKETSIFTWWMEQAFLLSDWKPVLSKFGFRFDSGGTPGMAVDLHQLNESNPKVDGLEIRLVQDDDTLHDWVDVLVQGMGYSPAWSGMAFDLWSALGYEFPIRNYLGYLNGEPVSISSVFFGGGVAGIYSVATLPKARGKGIGTALSLQPLLEARDMGYRIGVLQSSEMGFNVYKKLGFQHFCQIENFYLTLKG